MATGFYEQNTSGMNFDRFLDRFDESTLVTMKKHYWTAKQLLRSKLGKKEDDHLLASDSAFDAKITLFRSIQSTSENLLACIENYQGFAQDECLVENEMGRYFKQQGKREKIKEIGTILIAIGRALMYSSHQRIAIRQPIVRFYQELHVFTERAITDCEQTVEAAERCRLEYRGCLLWMKKTSEELDPDTNRQLDNFREAQAAVRSNKERLDKLKMDTLQKVDLLSTSRSNLLCHLLGGYLRQLASYYEKTEKAYSYLASNLSSYQHYEFEIEKEWTPLSTKRSENVTQTDKSVSEMQPTDCAVEKEENPETLIHIERENDQLQELNLLLFGKESPIDEKPEDSEERTDSPLGILEDRKGEEPAPDENFGIGPISSNLKLDSQFIPKLLPPPNDKNKNRATPAPQHISQITTYTSDNYNENSSAVWDLLLSQCDNVQQDTSDLL